MNWDSLIQLGALGVLAVLLVVKDGKRDEFVQNLFTELKRTVDANTTAISDLREEIRKGKK